jgi:RHH-type rel operon transcriptional repressor/antitoxin RelB
MSERILEYIEELKDIERAEAVLREIKAGRMKTYTLEEVSRELGLDD